MVQDVIGRNKTEIQLDNNGSIVGAMRGTLFSGFKHTRAAK